MSARKTAAAGSPATSLEVRGRLADALRLDLVGPWHGHAFGDERLQPWVRPTSWYLTGFLIPSGTPPEKASDADEDEDFELVSETAGNVEESTEDRGAAKKGYFPSSVGLSFLVPREAVSLEVIVRWGDYARTEVPGEDGKQTQVWRPAPRSARPRPIGGFHGLWSPVREARLDGGSRLPRSTLMPSAVGWVWSSLPSLATTSATPR
jgi:hypothetical protein